MIGGESRDCGEGLVVVLEFLSSRGVLVLVRYQELRGWCRVRAVRRWSESEEWVSGAFSESWGVTRL